jgi:uncharacterized membrane protein
MRLPYLPTRMQAGATRVLSNGLAWSRTNSLVAWLLIAAFSILSLRLSFLNFLSLRAGEDLAHYGQALWHLSDFRLPFSTFKGYVLWGDHAHFIIALLAPVFRFLPDVRVLLVAQALAVTTSGWAMYQIARETTKSALFSTAALFSYLSFIGFQYALDFDFHPSTLTGALLAWALYGFIARRPVAYWTALGLGLLTREDAAPIFFMLGLYLLFRRRVRWSIATMVISAVYFLIVGYIIMPALRPDHEPLSYAHWESKNPAFIAADILLHPKTVLQNLFDTEQKVRTSKVLFGSFGFLPLLTPFTYLLSAPIFVSRFLSPDLYRWIIENHSNANVAPILAVGAIIGSTHMIRFARWVRPGRLQAFVPALCGLLLLGGTFQYGWRDFEGPFREVLSGRRAEWRKHERVGIAAFQYLRAQVAPSAVVSASSGFLPDLSAREKIYTFPTVPEGTEWIFLTTRFNPWPLRPSEVREAVDRLREDPEWQILWGKHSVWAFRRKAAIPRATPPP